MAEILGNAKNIGKLCKKSKTLCLSSPFLLLLFVSIAFSAPSSSLENSEKSAYYNMRKPSERMNAVPLSPIDSFAKNYYLTDTCGQAGDLNVLGLREKVHYYWESKTSIVVRNTGSVALQNYHALLYFRVPIGKELATPPSDWHTPETTPFVRHLGDGVWELDLHFDKHILYGADSVLDGNVGLNLVDWSEFDKIVCGIALKDSLGHILFGSEPTVEECRSYDKPTLLSPLYTTLFKENEQ